MLRPLALAALLPALPVPAAAGETAPEAAPVADEVVAATAPDPARPAPGAHRARRPRPKPARTHRERNLYGGELLIFGGPVFSVVQANTDRLDPDGLVATDYALGFAFEAHAVVSPKFSAWLQLAYAQERETWDAPEDDRDIPDLRVVSSRAHLFHVGVRLRPFLKRVTPFLAVGLGPDLVVHETVYGGNRYAEPLFGLGLQVGGGIDVFFNAKVGLHLEVRNALTLHARRDGVLTHDEPTGGGHYDTTTAYEIDYGPVQDSVDASIGVTFRL